MAQREQLEVPFTEEEILRAVNIGLMAEYFLKDDITRVLNDFFKNSIINASSIPKKIDAKSLGDRWVIIDPLASHLVCTKSLQEFYWSGWNCFFIDHYEVPIHLIVMSLSMNGFERRENELSSN